MLTFHIVTVGCQMNVLDSEMITAALLKEGYEFSPNPKRADILIFNTCSIRQHAEDKIYSALGRLKFSKEHNPNRIIGVIGCMAQKDNRAIFKRAPFVDFVCGPGQIARIPELIRKIRAGEGPQMELSLERRGHSKLDVQSSFDFFDPQRVASARQNPYQAFVRVMFGCDQFCTYCIVPLVRGPEKSRSAAEILAEIRVLATQGCKEITLIGQTVSKYRDLETNLPLSGLLEKIEELTQTTGLERIRFVTSHPTSVTTDLIQAVRDLPHVMPFFHVPAQSGSDAQLLKMHRGYTVARYREMLAEIRETVPEASITSDFIVGFCGETDEDFDQTMQLVADAHFKNSYIFKFSLRAGTRAAELYEDDVPEAVKRSRNNALLALQDRIAEEDSRAFLNREMRVFVEAPSREGEKVADSETLQLTGHTPCDRIVVFDGTRDLIGTTQNVKIVQTSALTLFGEKIR